MSTSNQPAFIHWPFHIVGLLSLTMIIARWLWPSLLFDSTSLILFAIATGALLLPYLVAGLPPLRSLSVGKSLTIEFDKALEIVEEKVARTEAAPAQARAKDHKWSVGDQAVVDFNALLKSTAPNINKLISGAGILERLLVYAATEYELKAAKTLDPGEIVDELGREGFLAKENVQAFHEFWVLRNRIMHGDFLGISDMQTARFLAVVERLIAVFTFSTSTQPKHDQVPQ